MTREEAIKLLVNATYSDEWQGNEDLTTAHNMAIKALEQEPILEKIRAELEIIISKNHPDWIITDLVPIDEVLEVIDKYKGESEG